MTVKIGLQAMPAEDFRQAALPLFMNEEVEVLEWSFDANWSLLESESDKPYPAWFEGLIDTFSQENILLGHGFRFSTLSAETTPFQKIWLEKLEAECERRNYLHISEHFGFFQAGGYFDGAPLPVPYTQEAVQAGRDNLANISRLCQKSVGLENLALAFSASEARNQGAFLRDLLQEKENFLLLDLHNLYCQLVNFNMKACDLLTLYPLEKVREIHISGGSDSPSWSGKRNAIRRDTHDGPVPPEVFELLNEALPLCPNLEFVILERLGNTMEGQEDLEQFRADYKKMFDTVKGN